MKTKGPFLILFFTTLLSCGERVSSVNEFGESGTVRYTIEKVGEISFPLDSVTAPQSSMYQLVLDSAGNELLTFLNQYNNSIYFYDLSSGKMRKRLMFEREGPDGVGDMTGYHIHSMDTIFVYNYQRGAIFATNAAAEVWGKYDVSWGKEPYLPSPKVSTVSPIIYQAGNFYLCGNIAGEYQDENEKNRPVQIVHNPKENTNSYGIPYPEIYHKGNWGGAQYRWVYQGLNHREKVILYSFPADHYVHAFDIHSGTVTRHYAGSKYVKEIPAVQRTKLTNHFNKEEVRDHFARHASYHGIFHDPYQNMYLRIVWLPNPGFDPSVEKLRARETGVIILNDKLEVVGEEKFSKRTYDLDDFFVSEEGIFFRNYTDSEDSISFSGFKIKPV